MTFPNDAEREAVARALADTEGLPWGEPGDVREQARQSYLMDADTVLTALAPHVADREAKATASRDWWADACRMAWSERDALRAEVVEWKDRHDRIERGESS